MPTPKFDPDLLNRRAERRARLRRARVRRFLFAVLAVLMISGVIWMMVRSFKKRGDLLATPTAEETKIQAYQTLYDALFVTPTRTPTLTMTATVPTATATPLPSETPTPTSTATSTSTPRIGTRTPRGAAAATTNPVSETLTGERFSVLGQPGAINANVMYPNSNCSWMGVAGIATDARGDPMIGYYVRVGGFEDGEERETMTGLFEIYGESGYEITIARPVQAIKGPLWIQMYNPEREPVSEKTYFDPSERCERSLILINFQRE